MVLDRLILGVSLGGICRKSLLSGVPLECKKRFSENYMYLAIV